jgi:hypothetical protein
MTASMLMMLMMGLLLPPILALCIGSASSASVEQSIQSLQSIPEVSVFAAVDE